MGSRAAVIAHLKGRAPFSHQPMRALLADAPRRVRDVSWATSNGAAEQLRSDGLLSRQRAVSDRTWLYSMPSTGSAAPPAPAPAAPPVVHEPATGEGASEGLRAEPALPAAESASVAPAHPAGAPQPPTASAAGGDGDTSPLAALQEQRDAAQRELAEARRMLAEHEEGARADAAALRDARSAATGALADIGAAARVSTTRLESERLADPDGSDWAAGLDSWASRIAARVAEHQGAPSAMVARAAALRLTAAAGAPGPASELPASAQLGSAVDAAIKALRLADEERAMLEAAHDATAARLRELQQVFRDAPNYDDHPPEVIWAWLREHGPVCGPVELTPHGHLVRRDSWGRARLTVRPAGQGVQWEVSGPPLAPPDQPAVALASQGTVRSWPAAVQLAERSAQASGISLCEPSDWQEAVDDFLRSGASLASCGSCGPVHLDPDDPDHCPNCGAGQRAMPAEVVA